MRDTNNLMLWWESLTLVDRRTRSCKHKIVTVVETSLKNYVTADCGAAIALTSTEESYDGATEHQEGEKSEQ